LKPVEIGLTEHCTIEIVTLAALLAVASAIAILMQRPAMVFDVRLSMLSESFRRRWLTPGFGGEPNALRLDEPL